MADIPKGFYAHTIRMAYPEDHTYKVALYEHPADVDTYVESGECKSEGYEPGGAVLSGYMLTDYGDRAVLAFNRTVEWPMVSITCRGYKVYDADTGVVLTHKTFERPVGVMNGLFLLTLNEEGVLELGAKPEMDEE